MKRELTIKGRTGLFDVPSFTLAKYEDLIISVNIVEETRLGAFRLSVRHDNKEEVYRVGEDIVIPNAWINKDEGDLYFSLLFLNPNQTRVIKDDYKIEPLKYERINGNFEFSAQVQKIQECLNAFGVRLNEVMARLEKLTDEGIPLLPATDILEK